MPTYECSQRHYFRENGQTLRPGETIELTDEQAAEHNRNEPGLLRQVRITTQASVEATRKATSGPAKKPSAKRKK